MNLQKIISANLKGYRKKRGLTQEALAAKIHMSSNHYAQVERGEEGLNLKRWEQVAKILKIAPHLLLIPESYQRED